MLAMFLLRVVKGVKLLYILFFFFFSLKAENASVTKANVH